MAKFRVRQRIACWVTWTYEIEAKNQSEAEEAFYQGDHDVAIGEPVIGDSLWYCDTEEEFELVEGVEQFDDEVDPPGAAGF